MDTAARVERHVEAFNASVGSEAWRMFADRFTPDATMSFVGVPLGPVTGREAIAAVYARHPPDETMAVRGVQSKGDVDTVAFAGSSVSPAR